MIGAWDHATQTIAEELETVHYKQQLLQLLLILFPVPQVAETLPSPNDLIRLVHFHSIVCTEDSYAFTLNSCSSWIQRIQNGRVFMTGLKHFQGAAAVYRMLETPVSPAQCYSACFRSRCKTTSKHVWARHRVCYVWPHTQVPPSAVPSP